MFKADTRLTTRPLGGVDNSKTENDWIIYNENDISKWFLSGVNKQFALELVKRWNDIPRLTKALDKIGFYFAGSDYDNISQLVLFILGGGSFDEWAKQVNDRK